MFVHRPIKLGVVFDQDPHAGGGYYQSLNACLIANNLPRNLCVVTFYATSSEGVEALAACQITSQLIEIGMIGRALTWLRFTFAQAFWRTGLREMIPLGPFEARLIADSIDLVYFTSPCGLARTLEKTNFIFTLWDLCHRDHPEFPEVRDILFENRELLYLSCLKKATGIIVESETGKERLAVRYGVDKCKAHVIPFGPSPMLGVGSADSQRLPISRKYDMPLQYLLYPAQFWPHKNHVYILQALKIAETSLGHKFGAIFCGSDKGNKVYIESLVERWGLADRVRIIGFVDDRELRQLYEESGALVMPSYFGPTNLPPLEAFQIGVPVICGRIPGADEQLGDGALMVDLLEPRSLVDAIEAVFKYEKVRNELTEEGAKTVRRIENFARDQVLIMIIRQFAAKRICWDSK